MIQLDIPSKLLIRNRSQVFVSGERPVLGIPLEPFFLPAHSLHMLTLTRVRFEQHERRVREQDDVVFGVPISPAAILNQRVFGKLFIRHSFPIMVVVIAIFIVPANETCFETC